MCPSSLLFAVLQCVYNCAEMSQYGASSHHPARQEFFPEPLTFTVTFALRRVVCVL